MDRSDIFSSEEEINKIINSCLRYYDNKNNNLKKVNKKPEDLNNIEKIKILEDFRGKLIINIELIRFLSSEKKFPKEKGRKKLEANYMAIEELNKCINYLKNKIAEENANNNIIYKIKKKIFKKL